MYHAHDRVWRRGHHKYHLQTLSLVCILNRSSRHPGSLLGIPPSFMLSCVSPSVYIAAQVIVEYIPFLPPQMSLSTELPLSVVDGFTRAMLLCSLVPPAIVTHASPMIASSPWTLLLSSLVCHYLVFLSLPLSLMLRRSSRTAVSS